MVSRTTLICLLTVAVNSVFLVQQPQNFLLPRWRRFEWMMNSVVYVYKTALWMMHHGAPSPKRTWLWSNMPEIELLNYGTLTKAVREANTSSKTVRKYQDSTGKWRFVGTAALSASQTYPRQFGKNLLRAFEDHIGSCPVRRDLRFKPQYNKALTELEQFELLGLGDCWEDANLLEVVTYLMTSSKCRIPAEWKPAMDTFYKELQDHVLGSRALTNELIRLQNNGAG